MKRKSKTEAEPKSKTLRIAEVAGDFAEDKDWAAAIREEAIRKTLSEGKTIILDFTGISLTTQSFVHALISDVLRSEGEEILDRMEFKGCGAGVKGIIETVVQYSLETQEDEVSDTGGKKPSLSNPKGKKTK